MNDLISVIVPVYNVEKYLNKCVESICSQTYDHLEIILIDDGATDHSGAMCDAFAATDKRITVVHKENGGLSDARNTGISVANGEYICFFDSDDWVEIDLLEKAYDSIRKSDADVAIWGFAKEFVDEQGGVLRSETLKKPTFVCSRKKKDYDWFADNVGLAMVGYAWNKLYRRSILVENKLAFEKGVSLVEDMLFNSRALAIAHAIVFVDTIGNHYVQRKRETLGAKFYPDFYELKIRACKARETLLKVYGADEEKAYRIMESSYFAAVKSSCRMVCQTNSLTRRDKRNYMKQVCETEEARTVIKTFQAGGKDWLFRYALLLKQYWVFEVMYGR